jgi:thioredoxin 1
MNGVREIEESEFKSEVLDSSLPVLVDFYAPWCGPCRALAPTLEGIAKAYDGRLKVAKVNVDEAQELAATHGIRGVPTLLFFKDREVVDGVVGLPSAATLRAKLEAVAAAPAFAGA